MSLLKKGCFFTLIQEIAIFIMVYMIGGTTALSVISGCFLITNGIDLLSADINVVHYINIVCEYIQETAPGHELWVLLFDELDELFFTDSGVISAIMEFLYNLAGKSPSLIWQTYVPFLMRDLAVASLAHLLFFVINRIKGWLTAWKSVALTISLFIVSVFWIFASYCVANCLVCCLENGIQTERHIFIYVIILVVSFGIHTVSLAFSSKGKVLHAAILLGTQILFDAIRAIFTWLWAGFLPGVYFSNLGLLILSFVFVAFIFRLIESAEKGLRLALSYPLCRL